MSFSFTGERIRICSFFPRINADSQHRRFFDEAGASNGDFLLIKILSFFLEMAWFHPSLCWSYHFFLHFRAPWKKESSNPLWSKLSKNTMKRRKIKYRIWIPWFWWCQSFKKIGLSIFDGSFLLFLNSIFGEIFFLILELWLFFLSESRMFWKTVLSRPRQQKTQICASSARKKKYPLLFYLVHIFAFALSVQGVWLNVLCAEKLSRDMSLFFWLVERLRIWTINFFS